MNWRNSRKSKEFEKKVENKFLHGQANEIKNQMRRAACKRCPQMNSMQMSRWFAIQYFQTSYKIDEKKPIKVQIVAIVVHAKFCQSIATGDDQTWNQGWLFVTLMRITFDICVSIFGQTAHLLKIHRRRLENRQINVFWSRQLTWISL